MFDNKESRDAADQLGEIWDDVTRAGGDVASPEDRDAALAGRLQQMVPPLNETTRERMRARVLASQRGEAPRMTATTIRPGGLIAPLPQQPRSIPRPHRADHPIMRIAAMILLALSIGAAWLGIRSFSGSDDPSTPVQGALFATPTADEEIAFRETVLLHEVAPVGRFREFSALILRLTMPEGSTWDLSEYSFVLDANPVSFYVESGEITVNQGGASTLVGAEGSFSNGVPSTVENEGQGPATFIVLLLGGQESEADIVGAFPDGAQVDVLGVVPVSQPLGFTTVVNFSRTVFNTPELKLFSTDGDETLAFVAVNSGTLEVKVPVGDNLNLREMGDPGMVFTPEAEDWTTIGIGDSVSADPGSAIEVRPNQDSSTLVSAYLLTTRQQSPEEVAANANANGSSIDWAIPEGESYGGMILRSITLQPGAEWRYAFDGVTQFQSITGNVSVGFATDGLTQLTPGQYAASAGSGGLVIQNTGTNAAIVLQAAMSIGTITPETFGGVIPDGVTPVLIAGAQVSVAPGNITVHFGPLTVEADSTTSTDSELGGSMFAVTDGRLSLTPVSGDIRLIRPVEGNTSAVDASILVVRPLVVNSGQSVVIPQGAAYSMTSDTEGNASLLWFWFEPADSVATPSPAANTDFGSTPTPASAAADEASGPTPTPAPEEAGEMLSQTPTPAS